MEEDQFIKYPVELERSLMEGSYDQVWRKTNGRDVPGEEFALFSDVSVTADRDVRLSAITDLVIPDSNQHHPP